MNSVITKIFELPPVDRKEVFRYLSCPCPTVKEAETLENVIKECAGTASNKVVYSDFDISSDGVEIDLGFSRVHSEKLAINLKDCDRIILFAATAGNSFERMIKKYSAVNPVIAPFVHALGAERVEALCDCFNDEIKKEFKTKPRFSPGYGDLDISLQKDIIRTLDCTSKLGITLDDRFYMTPSKSVTAIIGIKKNRNNDMTFREYLKNNIVILDGGMGSILQKQGLKPGENTARWSITHPDIITEIHKSYFDAGSNVVNTNTFSANILNFSEDELREVISCAVKNARRAAEQSKSEKEKFVALDVGPTGKMLKPYGDLDFEKAVEIFRKTVSIGAENGVDLIYIETINDIYEAKAAILGAKEACDLPIMISCAFDETGKMMTGATPEVLCAVAEGMGVDAVGLNCSVGPDKLMDVAGKFIKNASVPVIFKPNAGLPDAEGKYSIMPDEFAEYVSDVLDNGVRLVGGCCGTTPDYITAVNIVASAKAAKSIEIKHNTVACSYINTVDFSDSPVVIGERINPTGKKMLKQALAGNDMNYILGEAIKQTDAGADCLDVNVGAPGINEKEMLPAVTFAVQEICDLPLQLDSSDFSALENALRIYNGKAVINSVNGSRESLDNVLPLVKKYGGVVVALTLDEKGIPDTVDGRIEIAERILKEAEKYGIDKKEFLFDALTTTVAATPGAALTTLKTVERITRELGCKTVLGVSNVSFGLPERPMLNSTFLTMAMQSGLSAAIINPCNEDMIKAVITFKALTGKDKDFSRYTDFAVNKTEVKVEQKTDGKLTLQDAVKRGLADEAAALTEKALESSGPLDVINNEIIPALNDVGDKYEKQIIFLPGLLISAAAAKSAFEVIKKHNSGGGQSAKGDFVLATVKGDVHDIGKNIVRLLLENYGFNVIDLGKDVPAEDIVNEIVKHNAKLAGLSALMTTTLPSMEETIKLIKKKAPYCKVIVGGAVLTEEYAKVIGADFYSKDAMATVKYSLENC